MIMQKAETRGAGRMNRKELIKIAKNSGTGDCHPACPYKQDKWNLYSVMYCMEDLIKALAEELEKSTLKIIPVGNGEDYEVVHNG